eukprot:5112996-Pleurochrysis_carterae.AAC.1
MKCSLVAAGGARMDVSSGSKWPDATPRGPHHRALHAPLPAPYLARLTACMHDGSSKWALFILTRSASIGRTA